jgi:hypothetical protein
MSTAAHDRCRTHAATRVPPSLDAPARMQVPGSLKAQGSQIANSATHGGPAIVGVGIALGATLL